MIRISRQQLAERWALTYSQNGYEVRAEHVPCRRFPHTVAGIVPDLEATKGDETILVHIIDSPESLGEAETRKELTALNDARGDGTRLHVIVAAECAHAIKERLDEWHVHADLVHVT